MKKKDKQKYEARAKILKAIAHPSRLLILDQLESGEKCVQDLTRQIDADISTVSKHLSIMKNVGLIEDEKRGTSVFYKLKCHCVLKFFGCIEEVIKINLKEHMHLLD